MATPELTGYAVMRHTTGECLAVCDTMKEARGVVNALETADVRCDRYTPFEYEIKGMLTMTEGGQTWVHAYVELQEGKIV